MYGSPLEAFGKEFAQRVRGIIPVDLPPEALYVSPTTGLVVIKNAAKGSYTPVGCPVCLGERGQNPLGEPTASGKTMLRGEDILADITDLSPEVTANVWLCPQCKMPQSQLLPKFDRSYQAYIRGFAEENIKVE